MYDLSKILDEAESLVTTFPQREALLRKAVAYFEQGVAVLRQAGYDPLQFAVEGVVAAPLPPQVPDVPVAVVARDAHEALLTDPAVGETIHPSNLPQEAERALDTPMPLNPPVETPAVAAPAVPEPTPDVLPLAPGFDKFGNRLPTSA